MAIAYVQPKGIYGGSVASITTVAITTTPGNLLHADSSCYSAQANNFVITDSYTNTWTNAVAKHLNSASSNYMQADYANNITGGSGHTFTQALGGSGIAALSVVEISGADTSAPLGLHEINDSITGTQFPTITTVGSANSGDIAIVALSNDTNSVSITEASGWTTAYDSFGNGATQLHTAVKVLTATGNVSYTATSSTSTAKYAVQITTYKAASGGTNVSITGVSATAAVGSLFASESRAITGTNGTALAGSVAANDNNTLVGVSGLALAGILSGSGGGSPALSGVAAAGKAGSLAAAISFSVVGVFATAVPGQILGAAADGILGVSTVAIANRFAVLENTSLAGASVAAVAGSPVLLIAPALVGVAASVTLGTLSTGGAKLTTLTGVATAGAAGAFAPSLRTGSMPGVSATGAVSSLSAQISPSLIGGAAIALVGSLVGSTARALSGAAGTAAIGQIAGAVGVVLPAAIAGTHVGAFSTSGSQNAPLPSVAAIAAVGSIVVSEYPGAIGANASAVAGMLSGMELWSVPGVNAAAGVGQFSFPGNAAVNLPGVFGTGFVGTWTGLPVSFTPVTSHPRLTGRFPSASIVSVFPSPRLIGRVIT